MRRAQDIQPGLPDVLPEEAPLPSEVVLDGHALDRRRREALAGIRGLLLDRPPDISPDDWRVVVATLAPPTAHLGRVAGSAAARLGVMQRARDCFPELSPSGALRRYRAAQAAPAVVAFLADFRALELADVAEQRAGVRERLWHLLSLADHVDAAKAVDPEIGGNHCKAAQVAAVAAKLLVDLDGLAARPGEGDGSVASADQEDAAETRAKIEAKVRRIGDDLRARTAKAGSC